MADESDDDERTHRRPDAEAARGGDRARRRRQEPRGQHLVHDRRRHADADGVRGADGGEPASDVPRPARQFLSRFRPTVRRSATGARRWRRRCWPRSAFRFCCCALAALRRQYHPAPHRVLGRADHAAVVANFAGGRLRAAVLAAGAGQFRQGPRQARAVRRGHGGAVVAAAPAGSAASSPPIRR